MARMHGCVGSQQPAWPLSMSYLIYCHFQNSCSLSIIIMGACSPFLAMNPSSLLKVSTHILAHLSMPILVSSMGSPKVHHDYFFRNYKKHHLQP
ncbi:predicted protein [Botrytis cinerea T4]|uniref:Uncharacterized protein n=1 Tax=Botryotinia fuckeliana (strain T4) TaxID=999810 RepID=G2XXT5_BOTF4|nr:predicted protein [Botrytis cinerea T4]